MLFDATNLTTPASCRRKTQNMSIKKYIISILVTVCACSCAADFTMQYRDVTMGNFTDGTFISDQGLTFDIVDNLYPVDPDTVQRAIISCDILSFNSEEGKYTVRLTDLCPVFTKEPVDSTLVTEEDIFAEDGMHINEIWYAAGYLNLHTYIPVKENSSQAHLINLVRNDKNEAEGVYEFSLKHNAYGEVITSESTDMILASEYISFPVAYLFKEDEQKVQIVFKWTSYEEQDGKLTPATKKNTTTLDIERGGYEHKHQK